MLFKNKKIDKAEREILDRLECVTVFVRHKNDNQIPNHWKSDEYVLGYFFFLAALELYIRFGNKITADEKGVILVRVVSSALQASSDTIEKSIEGLIDEPTERYEEGRRDAHQAFNKFHNGNDTAFAEFNVKMRAFR